MTSKTIPNRRRALLKRSESSKEAEENEASQISSSRFDNTRTRAIQRDNESGLETLQDSTQVTFMSRKMQGNVVTI